MGMDRWMDGWIGWGENVWVCAKREVTREARWLVFRFNPDTSTGKPKD